MIPPELAVVCCARTAPTDRMKTDELHGGSSGPSVSGVGGVDHDASRPYWLRAVVINYLSTEADADRILDTLIGASRTATRTSVREVYGRQRAQQSFTACPASPAASPVSTRLPDP